MSSWADLDDSDHDFSSINTRVISICLTLVIRLSSQSQKLLVGRQIRIFGT